MPSVSDNVNDSCLAARNIRMSHKHTDPGGHVFPESHTTLQLADIDDTQATPHLRQKYTADSWYSYSYKSWTLLK